MRNATMYTPGGVLALHPCWMIGQAKDSQELTLIGASPRVLPLQQLFPEPREQRLHFSPISRALCCVDTKGIGQRNGFSAHLN